MIPTLPHVICRQLAYLCLWALLPAIAAVIDRVDIDRGEMWVDLPEGLEDP